MEMILADTDALIDFLKGKGLAAQVRTELERGRLCTSSINVFELFSGAHTKGQQDKVQSLLAPMTILSLTEEAARCAAEIRRTLDRKGVGIGMGDSLIAGIAIHFNAKLLTRNLKHFERLPGLSLSAT